MRSQIKSETPRRAREKVSALTKARDSGGDSRPQMEEAQLRPSVENVPQQLSARLIETRSSYSWKAKVQKSNLVDMYGGAMLERVDGFEGSRALGEGFGRRYLPGTALTPATPPLAPQRFRVGPLLPDGSRREDVFGQDDRVPIQNSAGLPWRCVCHLIIKRSDNQFAFGTGWFAGPRIVVTAGHCIYDPDGTGWATEVTVVPGRNGDAAPFGYQAGATLQVHPNFVRNQDAAYDFGAVILPDTKLSAQVGWFGFGVFPDPDIMLNPVNTGGYPFDKEFGTPWYNGGRISNLDEQFLFYMLDTMPGDSGSPVFRTTADGERTALAIHTGTRGMNRGVRITPEIHEQLSEWYNM